MLHLNMIKNQKLLLSLFLEIKLYNKLVGLLVRKGNKEKAIRFLNEAFYTIMQNTKLSFSFLVWKLFKTLKVRVEVRKIKIKGKIFLVPFKIGYNRQFCLIIKWVLKAILENKTKNSIVSKIIEELISIYTKKIDNKMLKYREENYKQALLNRSNLHYRW